MKRNHLLLLFLLCFVFSLLSFHKGANKSTQDELKKRIDKFKKIRVQQCNKQLMDEALEIVDSMLVERAQYIKTSPISKPPIPPKPSAPVVELPVNATPIGPIIKD